MLRKKLVASLIYLFLSGAAQAATLFTPPLFVNRNPIPGTDELSCRIANVSSTNRTVRIQIIHDNGTVNNDSGPVVLPAGRIFARFPGTAAAGTAPSYCRFDVEGAKGNYRGSASILRHDASGFAGDIAVVPAE